MAKKKEEKKENVEAVRHESAGIRLKNEHLSVFIEGDTISGVLLDNRTLKAKSFVAELKEV